ncbi:MAG: Stf0 family sulfotransferase [Nitrospirota bacterium]|nr:Stf0 family sulfotransferase [Nitrospirota bacterium]
MLVTNIMDTRNELLKRAVRSVRDYAPFYAKRALMRSGVLATHTNATPFVVVTTGRSGSNLLKSLLNAHGQVRAYGELFRTVGRVGWDLPFHPRIGPPLQLMDRNPGAFLERYLYGTQPFPLQAVGFKLFYHHAQRGGRNKVWDYLAGRRDIRVIHLKRQNILRTYVSTVQAHRSGVWHSTRATISDTGPLHIEPKRCLEFLVNTRKRQEETDRLFSRHRLLTLHYEKLAADKNAAMKQVCDLLGIPFRPTETPLRKQGGKDLEESIANYEELKSHLSETEWEHLLRQ